MVSEKARNGELSFSYTSAGPSGRCRLHGDIFDASSGPADKEADARREAEVSDDSRTWTDQDMEVHRQHLAETLRAIAQWRWEQAEKYPDDPDAVRASRRAGYALKRLANFVLELPVDDRDLRALRRQPVRSDGRLQLGREAFKLLSRFGANYGAWQDGVASEAQMRNVLRRADGAESQARGAARE
jgi:hypothetical protein